MEPGPPQQPAATAPSRAARLVGIARSSALIALELGALFLRLVGVVLRTIFRLAVAGAEAIADRLARRRSG